MSNSTGALDTLKSVFGFSAFKEGQEDVVTRLLAGRSVLAIFPTGAGKSLCYQLPALMLDGLTLVISPLIALMKDQIDFLLSRGVAAARLDSTVSVDDALKIYSDLRSGKLKLLYVAPERVANERFLQTLRRIRLAMVAVDEAHCISEWGHNFRPDYMKLAVLARTLNVPRVLALTATATPAVAKSIAASFNIQPEDVIQTDFHRPNLFLHVTPTRGGGERQALLLERLRRRPQAPTIVYVTLQRTSDEVAAFLSVNDVPAKAYHAGMNDDLRHAVQDWFMTSSNSVVVATIAFGMGIDKRDIRYVYHYNLPKTLENYAQEIGRAGRDAKPAVCEVLAAVDDVTVLENFTFGDTPTPRAVTFLLNQVLDNLEEFDLSVYELSNQSDIRALVIETLLTYLELDGFIQSTGPFYTEYKYQALKPLEAVFARFDPARAQFLRRVFAQATHARTWSTLNLNEISIHMGETRKRLVAALTFLEVQGAIKLQVAGVRHGYRLLRQPDDRAALAATLMERFTNREQRDVERLRQVLGFVDHEGCRTRYLLTYFGETLDHDCGHCGNCKGKFAGRLAPAGTAALGDAQAAILDEIRDEHHEALKSVRQVARFLCGITSPSTIRAKLTKHPHFGVFAYAPFREVLTFVEENVKRRVQQT